MLIQTKYSADKGFTLIELLVAVSIIAILSTIGISNYQGIQSKVRDDVRKQDLAKLTTALELYLDSNNSYIAGNGTCDQDTPLLYSQITSYFTSDQGVPKDPLTKKDYCYLSVNSGQSYYLCAKLENCSDGDIQLTPEQCASAQYNYALASEDLTRSQSYAPCLPVPSPTPSPTPIPTPTPTAIATLKPTPIPQPTSIPTSTPFTPPPKVCNGFTLQDLSGPYGTYSTGETIYVTPQLTSDWSGISKVELYLYDHPWPLSPPFYDQNWKLKDTATPQSKQITWYGPAYGGIYYLGMAVYDTAGKKIASWNTGNPDGCTNNYAIKPFPTTCEGSSDEVSGSPVYPTALKTSVSGNNVLLQWQISNGTGNNDYSTAYISSQAGFTPTNSNRIVSRLKTGASSAHDDTYGMANGSYFYKVSAFGAGFDEGPGSIDQANISYQRQQCNLLYGPPSPSELRVSGNTFFWKYSNSFNSLQGWYLKRSDGLKFNIYPNELSEDARCSWWEWYNNCASWKMDPVIEGTYTIQAYGGCGGSLGGESNSVTITFQPTCLGYDDEANCVLWSSPSTGPVPTVAPSAIGAAQSTDSINVSWGGSGTCTGMDDEGYCYQYAQPTPIPNASGFHVYRSTEPLDLSKSSASTNSNTLMNWAYFPNLPSGRHYLAVKTSNSCGSGWSNYIPLDISSGTVQGVTSTIWSTIKTFIQKFLPF